MSKNREFLWVIRDECGEPVARCRAPTREKAIQAFCYPALRADAYFGDGGWTCEQAEEIRQQERAQRQQQGWPYGYNQTPPGYSPISEADVERIARAVVRLLRETQ